MLHDALARAIYQNTRCIHLPDRARCAKPPPIGRTLIRYTLDEARRAAARRKSARAVERHCVSNRNAEVVRYGSIVQSCPYCLGYGLCGLADDRAVPDRADSDGSGCLQRPSRSRDVLDGACHWNGSGAIDHIQPDACWSLRRGRPYEFGAGTISMPCAHVEHQMPGVADQHYVCLPIIAHGDTVGLLHIKFNEDLDAPSTEQQSLDPRRFAIQCAEHISLAIANVRLRDELRDQSTKDVLTGLFNRRYFLEILRGELGRSQRTESEVAIISFDADKFKTFNDNHGHDAGDVVLREIAECMRATFSKDDVLCRFGGEEFCVLMPETSLESAFEIAEKFRKAVEAVSIISSGGKLPRVTISGGVAAFPADAKSPQDLLAAADQALYKAKANGRNRMCKYIDPPEDNIK